MDACTLITVGTAVAGIVLLAAFALFAVGRARVANALLALAWLLAIFPAAHYIVTRFGTTCETALNAASWGISLFMFIFFALVIMALSK